MKTSERLRSELRDVAPAPSPPTTEESRIAHERSMPWGGALNHLRKGYDQGDGRAYKDFESFRAAWDEHGEALTANWILTAPGTRPAGYWIAECPFLDELPPNELPANPAHFGRWIPPSDMQPTYLSLHGVLTEAEEAALDQKDAALEAV